MSRNSLAMSLSPRSHKLRSIYLNQILKIMTIRRIFFHQFHCQISDLITGNLPIRPLSCLSVRSFRVSISPSVAAMATASPRLAAWASWLRLLPMRARSPRRPRSRSPSWPENSASRNREHVSRLRWCCASGDNLPACPRHPTDSHWTLLAPNANLMETKVISFCEKNKKGNKISMLRRSIS